MAGGSSSGQSAIGIDLGTTYSCVAVWRNNRIEIIQNEQGNKTTPSIVAFTDTNPLIGEGAKYQATRNFENTVFDVKRLIGRRFGEASVQRDRKLWPFKVVSGERDKPMIVVQYKGQRKEFPPEQISSFVLTKMADIAKARLGYPIKDVVVTVPAYFNELQRQATEDAGKIANLNVMAILNEPTAAAMAYGFDKKPDGKILIFDLGGGTFDVTIAEVKKGNIIINVKASTGDTHLGGVDFDNNMVLHFIEKFNTDHNVDISKNPKARKKLLYQCERAKRTLSHYPQTDIEIDSIHNNIDFSYTISRTKFEQLNRRLFKKCIGKVEQCLRNIKMDKSEIQHVVLVGGSTKIPKVRSMLQEFFNRKVLCQDINPDEAVAYGAALQAACLSNKVQDLVLHDVTPLSLGIWIKGGIFHTVVPRNTAIPTKKEMDFVTTEDNQSSFLIRVYQGERTKANDNVLLRKCELKGIPLARRGVSEMTVCFEIDTNGILTVSAMDKVNGNRIEVTIDKDQRRWDEKEIRRMVSDAERYKADDENHKKNVEAKNELEKMLIDLNKSIHKEGNIKPEDKTKIGSQIKRIEQWLNKEVKLVNGDQFRHDYNEHLSCLKETVDCPSKSILIDLKNSILKDGNIKPEDKAEIRSQIGRIEQWLNKDVKLVKGDQFRRDYNKQLSDLKKIVDRSRKSSPLDRIGKALSIALNILQIVGTVVAAVAVFV